MHRRRRSSLLLTFTLSIGVALCFHLAGPEGLAAAEKSPFPRKVRLWERAFNLEKDSLSRRDSRTARTGLPGPKRESAGDILERKGMAVAAARAGREKRKPVGFAPATLDGAKAGGGGAGGGGDPCTDCLVGSIGCGETPAGALNQEDCILGDGSFFDVWRLDLAEASVVSVRLHSKDFDTFLFLLDSGCAELRRNDDCEAGNLSLSCLEKLPLAAGTYFLVANSFAAGESGAYTIQVVCGTNSLCESCPAAPIACGEKKTGQLASTECRIEGSFVNLHRLELSQPSFVTIRLDAEFDARLFLFDGSCGLIGENDDCEGAGLNSCLAMDLAAGSYFIGASSFDAGATGDYSVQVACPDVSLCRNCRVGTLGCGEETESGSLTDENCRRDGGPPMAAYALEVAEPSFVALSLRSQAFDAELNLRNSSCEVVATGVNCGKGSTDSCLTARQLLPGMYDVVVTAAASEGRGAYELQASCRPFNPCTDCVAGDLTCAGRAEGSLAAGDCLLGDGTFFDVYPFEIATGQRVTANLTSSAFDAFLLLIDADCNLLAQNDDCPDAGLNSCIVADLPPGRYFVVANSFDPGTGGYTLDLGCADIPTCRDCRVGALSCNETVMGSLPASNCALPDGSFIDVYELELPQGSQLNLQLASSDFDTFLFLFDSACVPVAANDDCSDGVLNSCLGIGLAAGTYFIGVNSFQAGERGAYTLSVSAPDCNACPTCQVGTVVCNESVTGSLRTSGCQLPGAGPADFWRLTLAAESELQISLESTAFDPLLAVLDASCRPGERNDDCDPNTLNSCLRVTLPAGEHFIAATSFLAGEGGAYTLTVSCAGEGTRPGDASGDGRLGIADGLVLLRYLFADAPERLPCGDGAGIHPANLQLLDFNGNGRLNTADAIGLILYLFGQGSPHARGVDCTSIADCPSRCFSG